MGIDVKQSVAQTVNQQNLKQTAGLTQKQPVGLTGAAAAMNAAAMIAGSEMPTATVATTSQGSLLGVLTKEGGGNAAAFGGGNKPFSLGLLGVQSKLVSVLDNPIAGLNTRDRQAMNTQVGNALAKVESRIQSQQFDKSVALATLAQRGLASSPAAQEAAAKASAAGFGWSKGGVGANKSNMNSNVENVANAETGANINGQNGQVFGDFVSTAAATAKQFDVDITKMPIEDAMVYMTLMCSNDARDEMKDMLKDMEATRRKRAAIRQAETLMKEQTQKAKEKLTAEYNLLSDDEKKNMSLDDYIADKPASMTPIIMNYDTGTASLATDPEAVAAANVEGANVEAVGGGDGPMKFSDLSAMSDDLSNKKDSLADLSQEQQLKMQLVMENMTKMEQLASNISKKINDTVMAIISNFK